MNHQSKQWMVIQPSCWVSSSGGRAVNPRSRHLRVKLNNQLTFSRKLHFVALMNGRKGETGREAEGRWKGSGSEKSAFFQKLRSVYIKTPFEQQGRWKFSTQVILNRELNFMCIRTMTVWIVLSLGSFNRKSELKHTVPLVSITVMYQRGIYKRNDMSDMI